MGFNYTAGDAANYEFLRQTAHRTGIPIKRLLDFYIEMGRRLDLIQYSSDEELRKLLLTEEAVDSVKRHLEKTRAGRKKKE